VLSEQLVGRIVREIASSGGRIPFDRFMEMALYMPGLGYYVAGSRKFGEAGDFITAPELSPLFAQCLARQAVDVFELLGEGDILEFGAGSGVLARDMLMELHRLDSLPVRYLILEISPELQQRQQETLACLPAELLARVAWLTRLPEAFNGLLVANELLDAMPVSRFRKGTSGVEECFVAQDSQGLMETFGEPVSAGLMAAVQAIEATLGAFPLGYVSEINLRQASWLQSLAPIVQRGVLLLIDYGYPEGEYYHPQRRLGTLMCHYRHRAHPDPFRWIGLQDITAQVNFSALTKAACAVGFSLAGYTTQAHFLMANGLGELVAASDPHDLPRHLELVQGVKRLTLPSEMGERFKVLGLQKGIHQELRGFSLLDLRARL
jgi:SAM-dependent MidA family methyltransferase